MNSLRQLVREKLADGRLPHDSIPRVWGGPGNGESCHACDEVIPQAAFIIDGISASGWGIQLHVQCFSIWDAGRAPDFRLRSDDEATRGDEARRVEGRWIERLSVHLRHLLGA